MRACSPEGGQSGQGWKAKGKGWLEVTGLLHREHQCVRAAADNGPGADRALVARVWHVARLAQQVGATPTPWLYISASRLFADRAKGYFLLQSCI